MSAEIFKAPKELKLPEIDFANFNYEEYVKAEDKYVEDLIKLVKDTGYKGKNVGKIIRFPVADGYAQYMVISMKPLRLIHLELGDAWHFQYIERLTAKDVQDKIDGEKALEKLFGGK